MVARIIIDYNAQYDNKGQAADTIGVLGTSDPTCNEVNTQTIYFRYLSLIHSTRVSKLCSLGSAWKVIDKFRGPKLDPHIK